MVRLEDVFHTGFVVPDIEAAQADIELVMAVSWTDVELRDMPIVGLRGPAVVPLRFVYSMGPSPRLELLEPIPDTVWQVPHRSGTDHSSAHHLGLWCEDLAGTSARLEAEGFPRLVTFDDGSGSGRAVRFAYHQLPSGPLIELVDAARRPVLEAWFRGEPYPMADPADDGQEGA